MAYIATVARTTLLEVLRGRLVWVAAGLIVAALIVGAFLSQVALTERSEVQAAVLAALLRAGAVFIAAAFVISSMVRETNDKITELLLSQPVPRSSYLLGKLAGHASAGIVLAFLLALPLCLFVPAPRAFLWGGSLACELTIVISVSLFCVLTFTQFVPAFAATAGFYVLARAIEAIRTIAWSSVGEAPEWTEVPVRLVVDAIALFLPSLDRMTLTRWLVEAPPAPAEVAGLLAQTGVYVMLIGTASMFDLYRKSL